MGLFNHSKKKSDTIVGPSGFPYNNDTDDEPRRSPRHSVDSNRSAAGAAAATRQSEDRERRASREEAAPRDVHQNMNTHDVTRGSNSQQQQHTLPTSNTSATSREPTSFTSGSVPPAATTTTSSTRIGEAAGVAGIGAGGIPSTSTSTAASAPTTTSPTSPTTASTLERGQAKIVETAHPPHSHPNRVKDSVLSEEDAKNAQHDHKYLEPVIHERRHLHHIEEIERHRTVERHIHHVQHHVQPIIDEVHTEQVHMFREVPVTHIKENHAASAEDRALFDRLNIGPSTTTIIPHEKVTIDKGETMRTEHIIHHVHHIVQPIWQRDLHEYFRLNPVNASAPAPYTTSYTGPSSIGNAYYPQGQQQQSGGVVPNPASVATQHGIGGASSTGGSVPTSYTAKEGHKLVPIEGSRHELSFVNREPVMHQTIPTAGGAVRAPEVFPTNNVAASPRRSSIQHQQYGSAMPTAAAGHPSAVDQGMRNLSLGGHGVAK